MSKSTKSKTPRIFAFGFEAMGYKVPEDFELSDIGKVEFVPINDGRRLDEADGVICLQGLFDPKRSFRQGEIDATDKILAAVLPERFQQAVNLYNDDGWICFLVTKIIDHIGGDLVGYRDLSGSDLCKRMLNYISVMRQQTDSLTPASIKADEFRTYSRTFGTAHTVFDLPFNDSDFRSLTTNRSSATGFEYRTRLFFLPFYNTKPSVETTTTIVSLVATAVHDYRMKRIAMLPDWINSFALPPEAPLRAELEALVEQYKAKAQILERLEGYKGILATSNDLLKNKLIEIFDEHFGFNVNPVDDGRQDFMLLDADDKPIVVVEAKGTKGGIQRQFIQQLDAHRETNNLNTTTPGLLLVNNQMDLASIEERGGTPVDHIEYAIIHNCLILLSEVG